MQLTAGSKWSCLDGEQHVLFRHFQRAQLVSLLRFPNLYSATPTIIITDTVFSIIGQSTEFSGLMRISVHAILRQPWL